MDFFPIATLINDVASCSLCRINDSSEKQNCPAAVVADEEEEWMIDVKALGLTLRFRGEPRC
jgi:hypothetical protein